MAIGSTVPYIRDYYKARKGTMNGLPVLHISVNIAPYFEQECTAFVQYHHLETVMNDYNSNPSRGPVQTNAVHDLFDVPYHKPHFIAINCVSNSSYNPWNQLVLTEDAPVDLDLTENGPTITRWHAVIDGVQAPLPQITSPGIGNGGAFRFVFPGQRGRTNQVMGSSNLVNWTVLTNVTGTNLPILFRDLSITSNAMHFYRILRL